MQSKFTLLGSAALGAVLALGLGAQAQAKPAKHHHMAAAHAEGRDLSAEVEALRARLDSEELAHQQDQAAISAAQADAAAARAEAASAKAQVASQIKTIPGVIAQDIAKSTKPNWSGATTVGATVYADLTNISQSPSPNNKYGTGADIKRAYVAIDHKFNDVWSANLTADFAPNGATFQGGSLQGTEAVKKAYIQAKVFGDQLVLRGGAADMPWIPFVEGVYGYRFVEKTITDTQKIGNSADWGANANGVLANGLIGYSVSIVDGAGYKNAIRSKGMDVEGRVNLNWNGWVAAIGGYSGKLSKDFQALAPTTFHTATRGDALLAYKNKQFTAGVEYFTENNWTQVASVASDKGTGYSVFGSFNVTPQVSLFGRYDSSKPSQTLKPSEKINYFNLGVNYEPVKVIDLALVYKHDEAKGASVNFTDANTTFTAPGHYDEVGVFAQYKF